MAGTYRLLEDVRAAADLQHVDLALVGRLTHDALVQLTRRVAEYRLGAGDEQDRAPATGTWQLCWRVIYVGPVML